MTSRGAAFISHRWSVPCEAFHLDVQPLPGGLESSVALARITPRAIDLAVPARLVIKRLPAGAEREADVYDILWRHYPSPPVVRVLGRDAFPDTTYLYLEEAERESSWPWSDTTSAAAVCRELARLHDASSVPQEPFVWSYEAQLASSAEATLELATDARDRFGRRYWRRCGDLRRVVAALPAIRRRLLRATSVIHGDVHPGNVILRARRQSVDVVLIDWARARIGSPFEDLASWLHSLGCWEPQARRDHDSLVRAYLGARAVPRPFDAQARVEYWLASVSNGLSGAIRYHLAVLANSGSPESARIDSRRAVVAWERVVRRAAAVVNTNLDR